MSDEEFQAKMEARVSEICSKMAKLNQHALEKTQENEKRKKGNAGKSFHTFYTYHCHL